METIDLKLGKLYIMSGLPGSGKSTFLKQVPRSMIVSPDNIRNMIAGEQWSYKEGFGGVPERSQDSQIVVFEIVEKLIAEKCRLGLTVFLDATNVDELSRNKYANIAKNYGVQTEILIFDIPIEDVKKFNLTRDFIVSEYVIDKFNRNFIRKSAHKYQYVTANTKINFLHNEIKDTNLDIIGDVHGLYSEMIELLTKLGYKVTETEITHSEGRKLLFLGDFIDRGPDSLLMIELVMKAVNSGHYSIVGNHEIKLIKNFEKTRNGEIVNGGLAGKLTLSNLLRKKPKYQERIISFLKNLPFYYTYFNNVIIHANVSYVNLQTLSKLNSIYGTTRRGSKEDTDFNYQKLFDEGINSYSLIRGHIPQISDQRNVESLEEEQTYNGNLVAGRYESGVLVEKIKVKCDFNYEKLIKNNLMFHLEKLIDKKLVVKRTDKTGSMYLYKYSKEVFFKNRWSESDYLLKARGLVLDLSGKIVQHPFDKVFNYGENDTGLDISNDTVVIAAEKMNGFLGNIGINPFTKKLLITTTGSFDSDFVKYIEDFITPKLRGMLLHFLSKNPMTLSFEVIHPKDPHIIKYKEADMGLWLIGARGLNENDLSHTEEFLDTLATKFGFNRGSHFKISFGKLKELVSSSNLEGYMVRENNEKELTILKFKTPYYLVTKFLGRMGDSKIKFMFANPEKFKESIDEEFYPLVDTIIKTIKIDNFLNMTNEDKISFVRGIIFDLRS